MFKQNQQSLTSIQCFHCGEPCVDNILFDEHTFCCTGCKSVYQLLSNNNLCSYYDIEQNPGNVMRNQVSSQAFDYLNDPKVAAKLIQYQDSQIAKVVFFIPTMHCSSCIWLLENLYRLNSEVLQSKVQFLKKELHLTYNPQATDLKAIVTMLASIGYEPAISLNDIENQVKKEDNKKLTYQIGVAGFCFGNIMLISFPEYFGLDSITSHQFSSLFGYLNLVLSIPVLLFSAQDYFVSAWRGLKKGFVGIDVPLALGIFVMFARSTYEVITGYGIGWFDTHAGLVFFLLIGKWFQQKTFDTLSFDRDYKSYFPVAVTQIKDKETITVPVNALSIGDRILIRNNELIPADAILMKGTGQIDFSFVTGESNPVQKVLGEMIYAGGRQKGSTIELEVCKKVSQSYLTQLWNNDTFAKDQKSTIESFQQLVSRYFTHILLLIAFASATWWMVFNPSIAFNAFTAVLIIACPCALALSSPFALGSAMRILGKNKFYIKSPSIVEQMAHMDTIVFDKTGTLTQSSALKIDFKGTELMFCHKQLIQSLVVQSIHPVSQKIKKFLDVAAPFEVNQFEEVTGAGIQGLVNNHLIKIGKHNFVADSTINQSSVIGFTRSFVSIDEKVIGYFEIEQSYRRGLNNLIDELNPGFDLYLLSGDNDSEKAHLSQIFPNVQHLLFNQSPANKLDFVQSLKSTSKHVIMIGDGLNDAGALKAAHVGISITENIAHFSPASDVIMDANQLSHLPAYLTFSKNTLAVIRASFVISLLYNLIGLSFAVQGTLSPLFAAILMPISSVTVILFTTLSTTLLAKQKGLL